MANYSYLNYWKRKQIGETLKGFSVIKDCEMEATILRAIEGQKSILDIGAGDLKYKGKLEERGHKGIYHSQDIGDEFDYTYKTLDEITDKYDVILFLDVIEHLQLEDGLEMLVTLIGKLNDDGVIVLQTPNGRCIRNQLATDITHLHIYNPKDMTSYLMSLDFSVKTYRVIFWPHAVGLFLKLQYFIQQAFITKVLGCDYADNFCCIARKNK